MIFTYTEPYSIFLAEYWIGILLMSVVAKHLNPYIEKVYLMFMFT